MLEGNQIVHQGGRDRWLFMSSKPAWGIEIVLGQAGMHRQRNSVLKTNRKEKKREEKEKEGEEKR